MLGLQAAGLCQRLADQRNRRHRAKRRASQGVDTLGVQIGTIEFADIRANFFKTVPALSNPRHVLFPPSWRPGHLPARAESYL
jgi:hypothetical protein